MRLNALVRGLRAFAGRGRLDRALLFSLLVHALLLSLTFGDGLTRPHSDAPDLRVLLEPSPERPPPPPALDVPAAAPADASAQPAVDDEAPPPGGTAVLTAEHSRAGWAVPAASAVQPDVVIASRSASSPAAQRPLRPSDLLARGKEGQAPGRAAALAQLDIARQAAAPVAAHPTSDAASAPPVVALRKSGDAPIPRSEREARERNGEADQPDIARQSLAPASAVAMLSAASAPVLESLRRAVDPLRPRSDRERSSDIAQLDSARQDLQRSARQLAAAREDAERQEAAKLETARLEAARQQAAREEAARQQAAQAEAARAESERREAARLAAVKQEGLRLEAARLAEVQALAQAEAEQREARKRAIGRQLDEEAAKRDADRQRPDWTPARRGRLYSRTDANAELTQYGDQWARKIQFNQTFDLVREAAAQPHTDPVVTVAVRSNGSVESITFLRSSGVPALDEAIRRVVYSQENYPPFPAGLLRDFDVVEIRRTWRFDIAIRLD